MRPGELQKHQQVFGAKALTIQMFSSSEILEMAALMLLMTMEIFLVNFAHMAILSKLKDFGA